MPVRLFRHGVFLLVAAILVALTPATIASADEPPPLTNLEPPKWSMGETSAPKVGQLITVYPSGRWSSSRVRISYQWQADFVDIAGVTGSQHLIRAEQLGKTLSVVVTATDRDSGATGAYRLTASDEIVLGSPITSSMDAVPAGSGSPGIWLRGYFPELLVGALPPGTHYQWTWQLLEPDAEPIHGDLVSFYPQAAGAQVLVTVDLTAPGYHPQTMSRTVTLELGIFRGVRARVVGQPRVGETLLAEWVGQDPLLTGATYATAWRIPSGSGMIVHEGPTLTVTPEMVGKTIELVSTASHPAYEDGEHAASTAAVQPGEFTHDGPGVTITTGPGRAFTAQPAAFSPTPTTLDYQWHAGGVPISGADSQVLPSTLVPDPGTQVSVTVTPRREGYVATPVASDEVVVPPFVMEPQPVLSVNGEARVGETVTATVSRVPEGATVAHQWTADGTPISGAVAASLLITPDLAGSDVEVEVVVAKVDHESVELSAGPYRVARGIQTGSVPRVDGALVVGEVLRALPGEVMDDAAITFQWLADGVAIDDATGATLALTPALVGKAITVTTMAKLAGYEDFVRTSARTDPVAKARFGEPSVSVTGTAKVGETLTATASATPAPGSVTYEWRRGATVVGTGASHTLTDDDEEQQLTVTATLMLAGHEDATASTTTDVVATDKAPSITVEISREKLRLGQTATLTWSTQRAESVGGDWTGAELAAGGTVQLKPTQTGVQTYRVTARNANGTTSASVTLRVRLPRTALQVTTNKKAVRAAGSYVVRIRGLAAHERFTVRQGKQRMVGTAGKKGRAKMRMTAPTRRKVAKVTVKVVGSLKDRRGRARLTVRPRPVAISTAFRQVRASDPQVVTVRHLAKRERVTLRYRGRVVHVGRADGRGTLVHRFKADPSWGTHTVAARAHHTGRTARTTFVVGRRCAAGGWVCR